MNRVKIKSGLWFDRLAVNAERAIYHQWDQLEASGCIENFRIAAGEAAGFRAGWFFADSDAYKWLEAAARIGSANPDPRLAALSDGFISLLARAQGQDGYLFTYNQIHFPGTRWHNLQIEHELYCHGHLIEAGVSHFEATGRTDLLEIARRAADRIVLDFQGKKGRHTPGHEEIEIALLRLHEATPGDSAYLDLARQFIEQRGRAPRFSLEILSQNSSVSRRGRSVQKKRRQYLAAHPDFQPFQLPPGNVTRKPRGSSLRWYASALSGKYFQQHTPVRRQVEPVGHAVRFAYLETAVARLARISDDSTLLPALQTAWGQMVTRRMYVTGGIGSLPGLEGFGKDYELDPHSAYAETCAALGSMFWNWEMAQLTGDAKYTDLFEWQLYNAAAVGMGLDGTSYFYNNPLACRGGMTRQAWYAVPCCPSNLSRTWADLDRYIFSSQPGQLLVHQYFGSELNGQTIRLADGRDALVSLEMESDLPWDGCARIRLEQVSAPNADGAIPFDLMLRRPAWAVGMTVKINGEPDQCAAPVPPIFQKTASGYDPRPAVYCPTGREWSAGDVVEITFRMPIQLRHAHPKVRGHRGKAALTRGPLVYCLESTDNPGVDIFTARLDPDSLAPVFDPDLLGGIIKLQGATVDHAPLTFIPYWLWGNRGPAQMNVWTNI